MPWLLMQVILSFSGLIKQHERWFYFHILLFHNYEHLVLKLSNFGLIKLTRMFLYIIVVKILYKQYCLKILFQVILLQYQYLKCYYNIIVNYVVFDFHYFWLIYFIAKSNNIDIKKKN
jgi:hypothetical protein